MGKVIFMAFAAVVAWLLYKGLKKDSSHNSDKSANLSERMLKCEQCGVYMPESESMHIDGRVTCRTPGQCARRQSH